ncbi:hypothetical protein C8Z91_32005 [Paenibacillus elgii]|uniref:Carrier domain-containing protein n=1 Tax=Paenibacillus elgii TaxID=189691 RepID=A0A2T6FTJ6_9BACL|nr:hypothetical protein C8Z91_32005 [Paenibacillus elgii]
MDAQAHRCVGTRGRFPFARQKQAALRECEAAADEHPRGFSEGAENRRRASAGAHCRSFPSDVRAGEEGRAFADGIFGPLEIRTERRGKLVNDTSLQSKIIACIQDILPSHVTVDEQSELLKLGINSLTFIRLVASIEDSFEIEFADESILLENFSSVGKISDLVWDYLQKTV